jgi:thiamine kinase-like enzyme
MAGETPVVSVGAEDLDEAAAALVSATGRGALVSLRPLAGGANNRVYRVELADEVLLLKSYFRHANDPRDRLKAEYSFCRFAWDHGVRALPRPLARDPGRNLGLYEFVEGRRLNPGEVDADKVDQALAFFRAVNRHKTHPEARTLGNGSEACFSLRDHLECVDRRVRRLIQVEPTTPIEREASAFIRGDLAKAWDAIAAEARRGDEADRPLPDADRCLSPSDFGYHNALLGPAGGLKFLDFEYAGWDDPAKVACDFFCQPAVPAPIEFFASFAETVAAETTDPAWHRRRCHQLLPVYRVKWCCIMLNEFSRVGAERRRFAASVSGDATRQAEQLDKARRALPVLS